MRWRFDARDVDEMEVKPSTNPTMPNPYATQPIAMTNKRTRRLGSQPPSNEVENHLKNKITGKSVASDTAPKILWDEDVLYGRA